MIFHNIKRKIGASFGLVKLFFSLIIIGSLSACTNFSFGPQIGSSPLTTSAQIPDLQQNLPPAAGEPIGNGDVRVALLLPISGDDGVSNVGISMANGARLAMEYIEKNNAIGSNITLVLKDTAGSPSVAAQKASEAVNEGAKLILGPLRAQSVQAAGAVARAAGVPLIGFSNNSGAASNGVYLLNVLPETEVRRSLKFVASKGKRGFAIIYPSTDFGHIQAGAFTQAISDLGLVAQASYSFSNEGQARQAVEQIIPLIQAGQIDALFLPDRATAPSFAILLEAANIDKNKLQIIGSADWDRDIKISQTPYLAGAIYPAIDDAGQEALRPQYQARFGTNPHPFATIAYTATLLANSSALSKANPPYSVNILTNPSGFNGRDGLFRFFADGRSEYALIMKQVIDGGAQRIDGPRLP